MSMCFLSSCPLSSVLTLMMPDTGPQRTMSSLPNSSGLPCPRSPAAHSSPRNPVPCNVKCGILKEEHGLNNYGGNSLSLPVMVNYISISRGEKCDHSPPHPQLGCHGERPMTHAIGQISRHLALGFGTCSVGFPGHWTTQG